MFIIMFVRSIKQLVVERNTLGPREVLLTLLGAKGRRPPGWSTAKAERGHPAAERFSMSKPERNSP